METKKKLRHAITELKEQYRECTEMERENARAIAELQQAFKEHTCSGHKWQYLRVEHWAVDFYTFECRNCRKKVKVDCKHLDRQQKAILQAMGIIKQSKPVKIKKGKK